MTPLDIDLSELQPARRGRVRYLLRFAYWAIKHRSFKHVRWVLEFEGYSWN